MTASTDSAGRDTALDPRRRPTPAVSLLLLGGRVADFVGRK
ncbi:hypothetical protein [Streptomyces violaceusniger]